MSVQQPNMTSVQQPVSVVYVQQPPNNMQMSPAAPDNGEAWKQRRSEATGNGSKSSGGKFSFRKALNRANEDSLQIIDQFEQKYNECCRCWGCLSICEPCNVIDCCKGSGDATHLDKWSDSPYTWVMENRVEWNRAWPYQFGKPTTYSTKHDQPVPCQTPCCLPCWSFRWHCCMFVKESTYVVNYDKFTKAHPMCGWACCMKEICGIGEAVALLEPCGFPFCWLSAPKYVISDVKNPKKLAQSINRAKVDHAKVYGWKMPKPFMRMPRTLVCDFPCGCIKVSDI